MKASICSVTSCSDQTWHPAGSGPGSLQGKGRKSHAPRPTPTPTPTPTEGRAPGRRHVRGRARFHSPSRPFSFPGGLQPPPGDRVAAPLGLASIRNGRKAIGPGGSPLWKSLEFPRVPRAALWDGAGRDHGGRPWFLGHDRRVLSPSGEAGVRAAWGRAGPPRDWLVRKWLAGSPRPRGARGPGNLTGSHRRPRSAVPGPGGSPGSGPPVACTPLHPRPLHGGSRGSAEKDGGPPAVDEGRGRQVARATGQRTRGQSCPWSCSLRRSMAQRRAPQWERAAALWAHQASPPQAAEELPWAPADSRSFQPQPRSLLPAVPSPSAGLQPHEGSGRPPRSTLSCHRGLLVLPRPLGVDLAGGLAGN